MPPKQKAKLAKIAAKKDQDKGRSKSKPTPPKAPAAQPKAAPKSTPKRDPSPPPAKGGVKKTKSNEQIVKVITKGGAAVDSLVPSKDSYRVLQDGGKTYAATLNQSNLGANNNKFYIIQVLQHESTGNIHFWNRWGRVGVPGQNALMGPMPKPQAIQAFNKKHRDKTVSGDYKQIQIKYEDDEEEEKKDKKPAKKAGQKEAASKMDQGLQNLIKLIFDVNILNHTMKEIGYDAKKMPLGKLGDSTIKQAYGILNQLSAAVKKKNQQDMQKLSGDFYTLIPHDFGFQKMSNFILNNQEKVKEKLNMLSTISDLKITSKLLDQKTDEDTSIIDQNYKKLGCDIKTLDKKSEEYKLMLQYFDNTKGHYGKVSISQVFEVKRPTEIKSFNTKLGNNMLLWHGSRVSNFVGILSQGMRIAPPQAPASGYLFGKGIYLADMAEKSINYCRAHGSNEALILLIEGALGDPNILKSTNCGAKEAMIQNKKDSTKYDGGNAPPKSSYVNHKGMIVPKGKPVTSGSSGWGCHNEYIVYNINQAKIRYILRMNMNGQ